MNIEKIEEKIISIIDQFECVPIRSKLILVVAPHNYGKTKLLKKLSQKTSIPRINLNLELSKKLIEIPIKRRSSKVHSLVHDIIKEYIENKKSIILDNIELLFAVELETDPLRLFESLSHNYKIIVSWPGKFDGKSLIYAEPGHREYRKYTQLDFTIIDLINESKG